LESVNYNLVINGNRIMFDYQRLVHTKWRFYNKCWGDIINGVTTNIIFLQKISIQGSHALQ